MFKKNKKQTETIKESKEKKVRTVKVGTHKKAVIALWVVLIASVSFGVYKNFTAIDQHTTHEKEIIELRLQDTNGIENFVKNFAKSYYTWNNSKEAIEARTQAINGSVAVIVGISLLINVFIGGNVSDTTYYINLIVIAIITCFTFVCSYFLSAFIFRAKEF